MSYIIACSVGNYGYNCDQSCDGCLPNSCESTHGYCLDQSGCKPGWQKSQQGQFKCDLRMFKNVLLLHQKKNRQMHQL